MMKQIFICEVGPRDGLQNAHHLMPTEAKKAWIASMAAAGIEEIEVGSFVPPKLIPAMADTAEIVAFAIGDRSEKACRRLCGKIPVEYRTATLYSDFWKAYQQVLPQDQHQAVGKESGQTHHMQRWYCTLRQRLSRYVRKTLSFSKSDAYHHMVTKWYIYDYNFTIKKELSPLTL